MAVHQITAVDGDLGDLLNKTFGNHFPSGFINVGGCILPRYYTKFADGIENFEVRDDDVWVCSFPKTGTTWTQEMVWCIVNDLDFERGKVPIDERFPVFHGPILYEKVDNIRRNVAEMESANISVRDTVNLVKNMPSPRFIKSHLPFNLLPRQLRSGEKNPKVIYVCRNPKDTCISYYHYCKLATGFEGSFDQLCTLFLGDTVIFGPFWENILTFWNKKNDYNILFLQYEDMLEDLPSVIRKTATFLGKDLTKDQVSLMTEHLSFSNMKANPAVNYEARIAEANKILQVERQGKFMRNGTSGQWKTVMTPEVIRQFDDWSVEHSNGTGLSLCTPVVLDDEVETSRVAQF